MSKQVTYWLYGKHTVVAAIQNESRQINKLIVSKNNIQFLKKFSFILHKRNISTQVLESVDFNRILGGDVESHQGIAIATRPLYQPNLFKLPLDKINTLVMLDQVTDTQNIGAIIRTSAAFGVAAVIATKDGSPSENAAMVKTSAGAFEKTPYIQVTNLCQTIKKLKEYDFWTLSLDMNGQHNIDSIKHFKKRLLIFGSEYQGIRNINLKASDILLKINMTHHVESLNVASVAAICLHTTFNSSFTFVKKHENLQ